jgi:hypothetical protein
MRTSPPVVPQGPLILDDFGGIGRAWREKDATARACEKFERVSVSEQDAAEPGRYASDQQQPAAAADGPSSRGRLALGLIAALLTLGAVAFVWQSSYFEAAKLIVARWVPLAQPELQVAAPTAAPMSPELAQRVQTMERDLANMKQQIEQLKTGQEQAARNNTAVAEQLKASQEQLAAMTSDRTVGSARKPLRPR